MVFFRDIFAVVFALFALTQGPAFAQTKEIERTGGPYVPTPQIVVDQMLRFANVKDSDFVMDLGSGDGVLVRDGVIEAIEGG